MVEMKTTRAKVGTTFVLLGILLLLERGYFARTVLGAHTIGNQGWSGSDASKIQSIAEVGVLALAAGVLLLFGAFPAPRDLKDLHQSLAEQGPRTCPYCAETAIARARVCRHCRRELPSDPAADAKFLEAAAHGRLTEVQTALLSGADPNARDASGTTALHQAAADNLDVLASVLLGNGADPSLLDSQGKTASEVAKANGHQRLALTIAWKLPPRGGDSAG